MTNQIELKINLPTDGTFPPRLVLPGQSIWLTNTPIEIAHGVLIEQVDGQYVVYSDNKYALEVMVNDERLNERLILKDGDFIHNQQHNFRAIYQADPVKDFRMFWENSSDAKTIKITPTKLLRQYVAMDSERLSLDRRRTWTSWGELCRIEAYSMTYRWNIRAHTAETLSKKKDFLTEMNASFLASNKEAQLLITWILYTIPFAPSIAQQPKGNFFDAYPDLAHSKVLQPAIDQNRPFTAPATFILNMATRQEAIQQILRLLGVVVIASCFAGIVAQDMFFVLFGITFIIGLLVNARSILETLSYLRDFPSYGSLDPSE